PRSPRQAQTQERLADLDRPLTTFSSLSSAGHRRPTFSFFRLPISLDRCGTGQIRFALNSARRNPRQSQPKNMKIIISFLATVFLAVMTFAQEESASPAESTAPATEEKASATVEETPASQPAEAASPAAIKKAEAATSPNAAASAAAKKEAATTTTAKPAAPTAASSG